MRISKRVQRESYGLRIALGSALMAMTLLLVVAGQAGAAGMPKTVAEIALYQGPDREKILIEGAKKEGQVILYHSHVHYKIVAQEFAKKYPFIKASEWRSDGKELFKRVMEEYAARRFTVDAVNTTDLMLFLQREGILQDYYSPHLSMYGDEYKLKGKAGISSMATIVNFIGLGFNTERVSRTEAPKTLKDLLDPKWKGRLSITPNNTGIQWVGNALEVMGGEYLEQLSRQDMKVQNMSGGALLNLIGSGEVPLSPTIFDDTVVVARRKGAPVEWRSLEPVVTFVHSLGITAKSPHPHATMLFIDFVHSKEGQQVMRQAGISSPRGDLASPETKFKKTIFRNKYSPAEMEKNLTEWENLFRKLFIRAK